MRQKENLKEKKIKPVLSYQRLANIVSVCAKLSRRRENLSFGHHEEVASLPAESFNRRHRPALGLLGAFYWDSVYILLIRENITKDNEWFTRMQAFQAAKKYLERNRCGESPHRNGRGDHGLQGIGCRQVAEFLENVRHGGDKRAIAILKQNYFKKMLA